MNDCPDLLLLSLGTTWGLRVADAEFAAMAREAGASVAIVATRIGATDRLRRGYPVNDLVEAIAARRALTAGLRRHRPRAVVFSSVTAALLAKPGSVPFAIWMDSPARLNRPGPRNAILHVLERRQLTRARLVLPWSSASLAALPRGVAPAVVISAPIAEDPAPTGLRERLVVAYTPDPKAKGLELVCAAWREAAPAEARLVVTGIPADRAQAFLARRAVALPPGLELAGMLDRDHFRRLLKRARVFLSTARWEDFGMAPLEALERGAVLACAPAGGPFPALAIARRLDPEFVAADRSPEAVARAVRAALDADDEALLAYRTAAREELRSFRRTEQLRRLREQVLPALLGT